MTQSLTHAIVLVGGGAAGIATASSILTRRPSLDIAIVEPAGYPYYQPGWHPMASVMPKKVRWIREAAASFQPEQNRLTIGDGSRLDYTLLIVAPGIDIDVEFRNAGPFLFRAKEYLPGPMEYVEKYGIERKLAA